MTDPLLTKYDAPGDARAMVLVLHGGKPRSRQAIDGRSASWRRALWLQREITQRAHAADVGSAEYVHDHFTGQGVGLRIGAGHGYKVCEMALTCTLAMQTTGFRRPWDGMSPSR